MTCRGGIATRQRRPHLESETSEVFSNGSRVCVASVEVAPFSEPVTDDGFDGVASRRRPRCELITSEVMEVAGKALELGGEAQNQRLVQRVSTPPASTSRTSDQSVSDPKLIEPICTFGSPQRQRARYHDSAPYRVLVSVTQGLFPITGSGVNSPGQRPPARCRENRAPPGSEGPE